MILKEFKVTALQNVTSQYQRHQVNPGIQGTLLPSRQGAILMQNAINLTPAGELLSRATLNGQLENGDFRLHANDVIDGSGIVEAMVTVERSENGVLNQDHGRDAVDSHVICSSNSIDVTDSAPLSLLLANFDSSSRYVMNHKERGCFLIFDMEMFDPHLGLDTRAGTSKDAHNMYHTAKHMGFEYIQTFHNPTRNDVFDWMRAVSKASHHGYDGFGCAILTHGEEDDTLYASDGSFKLSEITEFFTTENCPTLAGKPKLFFIQACRGTKRDTGAVIALQKLSYGGKVSTKRPNQADFLIAFSTVPGFMAWRNTSNGSWFVQALHHCFSQHAKSLEIMQIMTKVNSLVAFFESRADKEDSGFKQIPSVTSQLTAELYFRNWSLDNETNCPVCKSLLRSRDSTSSNHDTPSTSQSLNTVDDSIALPEQKQKHHRSRSLRKWIRSSFRRKHAR